MNSQREKGVVGMDVVIGLIIFIVGSVSALFLYLNIYSVITQIKINEEVIGYITDIFERVDDENYDDINEEKMQEIIAAANVPSVNDPTKLIFEVNIINYKDTVDANRLESGTTNDYDEVEDLVKRITLRIKYRANRIDRDFTIGRIKVKEL